MIDRIKQFLCFSRHDFAAVKILKNFAISELSLIGVSALKNFTVSKFNQSS